MGRGCREKLARKEVVGVDTSMGVGWLQRNRSWAQTRVYFWHIHGVYPRPLFLYPPPQGKPQADQRDFSYRIEQVHL